MRGARGEVGIERLLKIDSAQKMTFTERILAFFNEGSTFSSIFSNQLNAKISASSRSKQHLVIPRDLEENITEVSYRVNIVLYRIALNHSRITSSKAAVWVIQLIGTHEEEV